METQIWLSNLLASPDLAAWIVPREDVSSNPSLDLDTFQLDPSEKDHSLVSAIKHVALNKVSPTLQGLFFQGEALGVSPVERCTHCKVRMAECQICSSETALLTVQEEDEYNILKEHVTMDQATGHLQARYPFKKDPGFMIDNGKDAKACQII